MIYGVKHRKYEYIVLAKIYSEARVSSIYGNALSQEMMLNVGSSPNHPTNLWERYAFNVF